MPPYTVDAVDSLPPPTADPLSPSTADLVPPPKGEATADAEPKAFGGGPFDLS